MDSPRRSADDLLEVVRVLLLLQGAILVTATLEAFVFGFAFGGSGSSVALSGAAAAALLVARARLRAGSARVRGLVYVVEGVVLGTLAIDAVLALAVTRALPPAVVILTRLVLPAAVIALLRRSARATAVRPTAAAAEVAA